MQQTPYKKKESCDCLRDMFRPENDKGSFEFQPLMCGPLKMWNKVRWHFHMQYVWVYPFFSINETQRLVPVFFLKWASTSAPLPVLGSILHMCCFFLNKTINKYFFSSFCLWEIACAACVHVRVNSKLWGRGHGGDGDLVNVFVSETPRSGLMVFSLTVSRRGHGD